jgi:hypothetical protein
MPKIEIDVDHILTSAVALEIEPGDHLLVMNGVVIGMVEKRARKPTLTIDAKPAEAEKRKRQKPTKPTYFPPADIMDVLRKYERPMLVREVIEVMESERDEPFPERDRKEITKVLHHLHEQRKVGVMNEGDRYRKYRLMP